MTDANEIVVSAKRLPRHALTNAGASSQLSHSANGAYVNAEQLSQSRRAPAICQDGSTLSVGKFCIPVPLAHRMRSVAHRVQRVGTRIPVIKVFRSIVQRVAVYVAHDGSPAGRMTKKRFGDQSMHLFGLRFTISTNRNLSTARAVDGLRQNPWFVAPFAADCPSNPPQVRSGILRRARDGFPIFHTGNDGTNGHKTQGKAL